MSYSTSINTPPSAFYATVVDDFYKMGGYNPATNAMAYRSTFPIQSRYIPGAMSQSYSLPESLTCQSQNPDYRCFSNSDCPGPKSQCGSCVNHVCKK